jgi:hypothetical protein
MSPYIAQEDRTKLDAFLEGLSRNVDSKGELTYALTMLALGYVDKHGKSYDSYSDVLGCLSATKMELYRTEVAKYEDTKRVSNGPLVRATGTRIVEEHGEALARLCNCDDPLDCPTFTTGDHSAGCKLEGISPRRCPCGAGLTSCDATHCVGREDTTDGGW